MPLSQTLARGKVKEKVTLTFEFRKEYRQTTRKQVIIGQQAIYLAVVILSISAFDRKE